MTPGEGYKSETAILTRGILHRRDGGGTSHLLLLLQTLQLTQTRGSRFGRSTLGTRPPIEVKVERVKATPRLSEIRRLGGLRIGGWDGGLLLLLGWSREGRGNGGVRARLLGLDLGRQREMMSVLINAIPPL